MSKIAVMREMLLKGKPGFTKEELAAGSGVALSTVGVQLGYHLKNQGYVIHKEEGKKYWMSEKTDAEYNAEAQQEGEEALPITPEDRADEGDDDIEPTNEELDEVKKQGLDIVPADAELEALLDE